ncbi:Succinyl-diaminopimelate desuccinylase [Clarias magur]|uniref:Succinyl-diaminopimelate desuccinylase n=1 Tax=Clarias magur TaxID=1594786 RepID=A0A8J4TAN3_CLAMG|nr:Succinyl-diaminopimelate desuccinylase [Clarias magur]
MSATSPKEKGKILFILSTFPAPRSAAKALTSSKWREDRRGEADPGKARPRSRGRTVHSGRPRRALHSEAQRIPGPKNAGDLQGRTDLQVTGMGGWLPPEGRAIHFQAVGDSMRVGRECVVEGGGMLDAVREGGHVLFYYEPVPILRASIVLIGS